MAIIGNQAIWRKPSYQNQTHLSRGCTVPDLNRSNEPKKGTRTAVLMSARTVVLFYFILEQFFQVFHSVVTYLDPFLRFVGLHMEFIASYVKALLL